MDLSIYVDAVMQKMKDSNYYSEIEEKELKFIIEKYLRDEYNDRVAILNLQIDLENAKGSLKGMDFYRSKMMDIKSHLLHLTKELGKTK